MFSEFGEATELAKAKKRKEHSPYSNKTELTLANLRLRNGNAAAQRRFKSKIPKHGKSTVRSVKMKYPAELHLEIFTRVVIFTRVEAKLDIKIFRVGNNTLREATTTSLFIIKIKGANVRDRQEHTESTPHAVLAQPLV